MAWAFRVLAAALLLIGLVSAPAGAAPLRTFYVDPAGNDAAAGSDTQPWRTLQKAANTVRAGDLVIVRAGRYAGLYLTTSGTASDPITFRGEAGAIVDTQNPTTQDGINLEGASYVIVEGFTVTGVPRAGIRSVVNHHVIIRGNTGDLNGRWGILTGFSDDILIENNVMSRSQAEHGIYISNSGDRPVIRKNVVFGNRANGIHMNGDVSQGGDGVISGALVEDNTIFDNGLGGGSGINCDGVQSSVFRNNLLYNNHASGISLYQIDAGEPARDNQVLNNTVVMASDARWAINIQNASTGNVLRNNILFNQHSFRGSVAISADSLPGFVSDTNVVMDRFSIDGGDTRIGLAAWRAATGQDQSSLIAAPAALFVNFAGNDYHLSVTSPARDAGVTLAAVPDDLEGAPRPQGPASDIGAYEFPATAGPVQLAATKAGTGTVTSTPAGIDCGSSCTASFTTGTAVSLTATPAAGWVFMGWSGAGCPGTGSCSLTLTTATTVRATFAPAPVTPTVIRAGLGSGLVTSARAGRHLLRHELLGELPVRNPRRPHGDGRGRLGLHRLVRRRLHGNEHLHDLSRQLDDDHRDLRAHDGRRAHADCLGLGDRQCDQRPRRPVVRCLLQRELRGGHLGRPHRDGRSRECLRRMVWRLHRLGSLHGRDGSSSRGDGAVQPRLHGFDADPVLERDPRDPRDRASGRHRRSAHASRSRGLRLDRRGHRPERDRRQADPSGRAALGPRHGLHRARALGPGVERRGDHAERHAHPGRPHRRAPRRRPRAPVARSPPSSGTLGPPHGGRA